MRGERPNSNPPLWFSVLLLAILVVIIFSVTGCTYNEHCKQAKSDAYPLQLCEAATNCSLSSAGRDTLLQARVAIEKWCAE